MTRAFWLHPEIRRVFETPLQKVEWDSFFVWSLIALVASAEIGIFVYWLYHVAVAVARKFGLA